MDAFSYTDIFDTKGIEYLIVIAFLVILIPTWRWLNRPVKASVKLARSVRGLSAAVLRIPAGLYYDPRHTWAFLGKNGSAKIGVDDLLLHITGGVSVDFLKKEGEEVRKGDFVARIFNGDKELKISSPVSGEIRKMNSSLEKTDGYINTDPYDKGWLYQVKPDDWKNEVKNYRLDREAVEWTKTELERCREFIINHLAPRENASMATVLQAGGEMIDHPLAEMPGETWNKFQQEFLS